MFLILNFLGEWVVDSGQSLVASGRLVLTSGRLRVVSGPRKNSPPVGISPCLSGTLFPGDSLPLGLSPPLIPRLSKFTGVKFLIGFFHKGQIALAKDFWGKLLGVESPYFWLKFALQLFKLLHRCD